MTPSRPLRLRAMPSEPCSRTTTSPAARPSSRVRKGLVSRSLELTTGKTVRLSEVAGSSRRQSPAGWRGVGVVELALQIKPSAAREDSPSRREKREPKRLRSIKSLLSRAAAEASHCMDRTEAERNLAGRRLAKDHGFNLLG